MTSTTALKKIAESLNDITTRHLPKTAVLYCCTECVVTWINNPECWCCGNQGTAIAKPLHREGLDIPRAKSLTLLSANHYIDNEEFAHHFKERYSCVRPTE